MDRRRFLRTVVGSSAAALFGANPGWGARQEAATGSMKITRVTLYVVNVPERKWWWSDDFYGQPEHQRADNYVAEVETDQGLVGLTRIFRLPDAIMAADLPAWVGRDVMQTNLQTPGVRLVGAFEQAVLDLRGQALGVPVWQLLGGKLRDRILAAQTTGYKTPQHTAEQAQWGWEEGFRVYKMKCITPREDTDEKRIRYVVDRIEAIHKLVPDMLVRPDIRWRLREVWAAQEVARRLRGHAMDAIESPINKRAFAGSWSEWRRLRETIHLPIADHVGHQDLVPVFEARGLDHAIVGHDSHLQTLRMSHLAHELGLNGWSQTVAYGPGSAMGLHVAACMPHLTKAYDLVGPYSWIDTLVNEPFRLEDGSYAVPDRPGLGYTLNHDAVKKYLVRKQVFS
jgi:galactonate dehydratase